MAMALDSSAEVNALLSVENVKTEDNSDNHITIKFEPLEPDENYVTPKLEPLCADALEVAGGGKVALEGCDAGLNGNNSSSNENHQVGSPSFSVEEPCPTPNSSGAIKKEPMMMSAISTPESVNNLAVRSDFDLAYVVKDCEVRLVRCKLVESILQDQFGTKQHCTISNILRGYRKKEYQKNSPIPQCFNSNEDEFVAREKRPIAEDEPAKRIGHLKKDTKREKKFACDSCNYTANRRYWLERHLLIHQESRDKPFGCNHCEYRTDQKPHLTVHLRTHQNDRDKPFACSHCDYRTDLRGSLRVHLRTHQRNREKPFACSHCDYRTDHRPSLRRHLSTHQSNREKPFACSHCDYRTDLRGSLRVHLRTHQRNRNKPLACSHCNYRTDHRAYLQVHLRTHQSYRDKPFACSHCDYRTDRKCYLQVHLRTHQSNRDKPLACSHCNYRTDLRAYLRVHFRTHQPHRQK